MPDEKKGRDWVDTVSKLLIPIVLFGASAWFSYQKNKSDAANQQFQRESEVLKLAASSNETERRLGLKTIEILQRQGRFSVEMLPVVQAISQGPRDDQLTQSAQTILVNAQRDPAVASQIAATAKDQLPAVYLQMTDEAQRGDVNDLVSALRGEGYDVPGIELVNPGTQNTYVRLFSERNQKYADQVLQKMKTMGFDVQQQDFSKTPLHDKTPPGVLEVWIGHKQGALKKSGPG